MNPEMKSFSRLAGAVSKTKARIELGKVGVSVSGGNLAVMVVEASRLSEGQDGWYASVVWEGVLFDDRVMRRRKEELEAKDMERLIG